MSTKEKVAESTASTTTTTTTAAPIFPPLIQANVSCSSFFEKRWEFTYTSTFICTLFQSSMKKITVTGSCMPSPSTGHHDGDIHKADPTEAVQRSALCQSGFSFFPPLVSPSSSCRVDNRLMLKKEVGRFVASFCQWYRFLVL